METKPLSETSDKRFALLIDADNVSARYIKPILNELSKYGTVTIKRIYGDWTLTLHSKWKDALLENSITPIQQFGYTQGKNATDSAMIIDAMDLLYTDNVDGFCLVSSDSDFTRLASRLRESGRTVIGMGEKKTPVPFRRACDVFTTLELLVQNKRDRNGGGNEVPKDAVEQAVVDIITDNQNNGKATGLGEIGSRLQKRYPDFDVRSYGTNLLSKLLEEFTRVTITKDHSSVTVELAEGGEEKPARPSKDKGASREKGTASEEKVSTRGKAAAEEAEAAGEGKTEAAESADKAEKAEKPARGRNHRGTRRVTTQAAVEAEGADEAAPEEPAKGAEGPQAVPVEAAEPQPKRRSRRKAAARPAEGAGEAAPEEPAKGAAPAEEAPAAAGEEAVPEPPRDTKPGRRARAERKARAEAAQASAPAEAAPADAEPAPAPAQAAPAKPRRSRKKAAPAAASTEAAAPAEAPEAAEASAAETAAADEAPAAQPKRRARRTTAARPAEAEAAPAEPIAEASAAEASLEAREAAQPKKRARKSPAKRGASQPAADTPEGYIRQMVVEGGEGGIMLSTITDRLRARFKDFKVRDLGYAQMRQYMAAIGDYDLEQSGRNLRIRLAK